MVFIRRLIALYLFAAGYAFAQSPSVDCTLARDPERCLINQAALAACADLHGRYKTACLNEHIPPIDCSKSANPSRCEATERAKQTCASKSGKTLKACLQGGTKGKTKKVKKAAKAKPAKPAKSARSLSN
jgi:hypothetical protein